MLRLAYENNKLVRLPIIHKLKVHNVRQGFFEEGCSNGFAASCVPIIRWQLPFLKLTDGGYSRQY
jgi:hypothetical protein